MSDIILVILAIILLFSFFWRYIFFFLMRAFSQRLFNQFQQQPGFKKNFDSKPEGSVTIDTNVAGKKNKKDNENGDYIDYEEIK